MSRERLLVGLTGGLAAGKSTVGRVLRAEGCRVRDADQIVAELYRPQAPGTLEVARMFGPEFLNESGGIDHSKLAALIFSDTGARERLESAIHPLVRQSFGQFARDHQGVLVLEAPLLVEAGYAPDFEVIISVEAPFESRLQWAIERGLSEEDARSRLLAQGDGSLRRSAAHRILNNDGTLEEFLHQAWELARELRTKVDEG